jgi:hypothetical protein
VLPTNAPGWLARQCSEIKGHLKWHVLVVVGGGIVTGPKARRGSPHRLMPRPWDSVLSGNRLLTRAAPIGRRRPGYGRGKDKLGDVCRGQDRDSGDSDARIPKPLFDIDNRLAIRPA